MDNQSWLNFIREVLEPLGLWSYLLVFVAAFLESIVFLGLAVPGTILMLFFGFLSSEGLFNLYWLIGLAVAGSLAGDLFSFWMGKRDYSIFSKNNRIVRYVLKRNYLQKGEQFFQNHGGKSIFLGRFVGPFRPIIPFVAGVAKMPTKKFIFWNLLGAVSWSVLYALLGFFFGEAWQTVSQYSPQVSLFAIGIFILVISGNYLKRYIARKGREWFLSMRERRQQLAEAAKSLPAVEKSMEKHPGFYEFLKERWSKTELIGRPLTWSSLLVMYLLLTYTKTVNFILESAWVSKIDANVLASVISVRTPFFVEAFSLITLFGDWQVIAVESALIIGIFFFAKKQEYVLPLLISAGGSYGASALGKWLIERPRPDAFPVLVENTFSFPSAHAAIAIGFYGFILFFLMRQVSNWAFKTNLFFFGILLILAIGFSRIYLGVHYATDVFGGYLLGGLWLLVAINVYRWLAIRSKNN